jgi:glyoxylase-like metal-dependent hydrolase (beta-lactamase superfamily II)
VYLIEHERGLVLFDTGQDRRSTTDPDYFPRGFVGHLFHRLARFEVRPDETLTERLGSLGYSPDHVHTVVLSHLHQDHIGGLPELPNANILVSADEWPSVNGPFADEVVHEKHWCALRTRYPDLVILAAHDPAAQGLLERAVSAERA